MKFLSILAAASLALAPAIASAGSSGDSTDSTDNGRPISGPLAGRVLDDSVVPVPVIVIGGLVLVGAAAVALIGGDGDAAVDTIPTTVGTNNGTN